MCQVACMLLTPSYPILTFSSLENIKSYSTEDYCTFIYDITSLAAQHSRFLSVILDYLSVLGLTKFCCLFFSLPVHVYWLLSKPREDNALHDLHCLQMQNCVFTTQFLMQPTGDFCLCILLHTNERSMRTHLKKCKRVVQGLSLKLYGTCFQCNELCIEHIISI